MKITRTRWCSACKKYTEHIATFSSKKIDAEKSVDTLHASICIECEITPARKNNFTMALANLERELP